MSQGMNTVSLALAAAMEHIPDEIRQAMLKLERLSTLPRRCLVAVAEAARVVDYKAGAVIVGRDSQPVVLFLLQGRVIVKHSNGSSMRYDATDEPLARPLYRAGEEVEIIAARGARLLQIPNAVYVRQLSLAASEPRDDDMLGGDGVESDGLDRCLTSGVLSQVPAEQVKQLVMGFQELAVRPGNLVYAAGDPADAYFIVQHGAIELYAEHGGQRSRVAVLGPGDAFGEEALLLDAPRTESALPLTGGSLLRVSRDDFDALVRPALVRPVAPPEATALVNAGASWLDVRESPTQAVELNRSAIKLPLSTLRAKRGSLSTDRAYIVYAADVRVEALACFMLAEAGLSAFTLDGLVEEVGADSEVSFDFAVGGEISVEEMQGEEAPCDEVLGGLELPPLEMLSDEAFDDALALESLLNQGDSVFGLTLAEPDAPGAGDAEPEPERTTALEPRWVELELTGLDGESPPPAADDVEALLAAERSRYERRLAKKVAELRLLARRKAKEVLNRRTAELRRRVNARMQELRAEKKALEASLRAGDKARAALAAERQALAQERAALDAERAAFELERASSKRRGSRRRGDGATTAQLAAEDLEA